ncbi:hypothetical protein [Amantichitinum ursilacus]|uniref:hypothetical protein n=1 Tax=Amantichitinum ursilacus TaxID=857265 RepID=UPI0006B5AD67|nr:hypothetical protein [Amantichitinum ursilacus]
MSVPAPQAPHTHEHGAGHDHSHNHSYSQAASHAHAHRAPKAPGRPPLAARLFAAGAAQRLLIAIVPLALVWLFTWWALQ